MIAGRPQGGPADREGRSGQARGGNGDTRRAISRSFQRFVADEAAPTAVEYALMVAAIVLVVIGAVVLLGGQVGRPFNATAGTLDNAIVNPN